VPTLDKYRLRLELELAQGIAAAPVNLFTGAAPLVPRSRDLQWEIVLLNNGALDSSVGNITSMVLEVKTFQSPASSPLISVSISGAAINTNLTDAARQAQSDQHAILVMTAGMTGLDMTGADVNGAKPFNLVLTATRNGNLVSLAAGTITVVNDGGQYSGNTPTAGDPTYYNKAQIDGMFAAFLKQFNDPGVALILTSPAGQWTRRFGVDDAGNRTDDLTKNF